MRNGSKIKQRLCVYVNYRNPAAMLYLRTDYFLISDITKGYGLSYLDYISFSSANWCATSFPVLYLNLVSDSFCTGLWRSCQQHASLMIGGKQGGVRSEGEGTWAGGRPPWIKLWRGDVSHWAAVALIYSTYDRCFCLEMHHCGGSIRVLQSKVNLTSVHLNSPWFPACFLPAYVTLFFLNAYNCHIRDRRAHKNPLPPPNVHVEGRTRVHILIRPAQF